jgi:FlaA1/EpsC-like NDP-sugar epimerase
MSAAELLLFPCNGNALEALDCLGSAFRCVGFVDDTPAKQGTTVAGIPVLSRAAFAQKADAQVLAVRAALHRFTRAATRSMACRSPRSDSRGSFTPARTSRPSQSSGTTC